MKVVVVGGSGLIGDYIVRDLLQRGHAVRVVTRTAPQDPIASVEYVRGDYLAGLHESVFEGRDALIQAASTDYRVLPKESDYFHRTNVVAMGALFVAAQRAGLKRAVYVSSFYHAIRPDLVTHPYVRSRRDAEDAVLAASEGNLSCSIIQPGWVMGVSRGTQANLPGLWAKWALSGWPMWFFPGGTNWVSGRSVGAAVATALERGERRARYLVGDENRSWESIFQEFAGVLGVSRKVRGLPGPVTKTTAAATALMIRLRRRHSGLNPMGWMRVLCGQTYFDGSAAARALGYPTGDVSRAVAETANYWQGRLLEGSRVEAVGNAA